MIPIERVQQIVSTYEALEKELASGDIDKKDFVRKSKEYSNIGEVINEAKEYIGFEKEKEELKKIIDDKNSDKDMIQLAKNELDLLLKQRIEYEKKLKLHLLPKDDQYLLIIHVGISLKMLAFWSFNANTGASP